MNSQYKTTWHLVIEPTPYGLFIKAVYGAALLDLADIAAKECGGYVRSLCSYGLAYHAGQTFND